MLDLFVPSASTVVRGTVTSFAGKVLYNKEAASTKIFRNLVRHVPWDHGLEPALTVAQNVQLAAHLSLPPHFTPHRRASLVQEVLELLALTPLQHCLVGSLGAAGQQEKALLLTVIHHATKKRVVFASSLYWLVMHFHWRCTNRHETSLIARLLFSDRCF